MKSIEPVEVPESLDSMRIDRVVSLLFDVSRARAAQLISAGSVALNDQDVSKSSTPVCAGDVLKINEALEVPGPCLSPDSSVEVNVVYEDADVVVLDKHADQLVHPGAGESPATLVAGLISRFPEMALVGESMRPGVVHRLDVGTSGLLVFARTQEGLEHLRGQFDDRSVWRAYKALISGHMEADSGLVDAPIGRSRRNRLKMAVTHEGKPARTRFVVERSFFDPLEADLLSCRLETGRTHQIRVHFEYVGHPVVGDSIYGKRVKGLKRQFLHAYQLGFTHPRTGQKLRFESELPQDLTSFLAGLG